MKNFQNISFSQTTLLCFSLIFQLTYIWASHWVNWHSSVDHLIADQIKVSKCNNCSKIVKPKATATQAAIESVNAAFCIHRCLWMGHTAFSACIEASVTDPLSNVRDHPKTMSANGGGWGRGKRFYVWICLLWSKNNTLKLYLINHIK